MRFSIILYISIFTTNICHAQLSFKINTGYSYNHLITDVSNRTFTKNVDEIGYSIGLQLNYSLSKSIILETGICWIQKNYSFRRTGTYVGIYDQFTNNYLQIPFTLQLKVFEKKKWQVFLNIGSFVSYLTNVKVNGVIPNPFNTMNQLDIEGQEVLDFYFTNYSKEYHFNSLKENLYEFGLLTGLGLQYNLNEKIAFILDYRLYQSLTDTQRKHISNHISKINQTYVLSIGLIFKSRKK